MKTLNLYNVRISKLVQDIVLLLNLINAFKKKKKKIHKPAGQRIFQTQGPGHTSIYNSLTKTGWF